MFEQMLSHKIKADNPIFLNAEISLQTIAGQHPFVNGNKRTGIATVIVIWRNVWFNLIIRCANQF
ncbi:Fic family protein [Methanosarcina sp. WWM596]|uniref:Fic family protein n=1 Tax=Methanosarcina sp. WWM596 TaxID=1434103 RepID=UPI00350EB108